MVEKNDTVAVLKPFVDGGLAGGFASYFCSECVTDARKHPKYWRHCIKVKMIPRMIWIDAFAFSQTLGFYGILSRKVIASNDGRRPRLDQEAACGSIAGAAGAYVSISCAAAITTVSAAACAQLLLDASFFNSARQTLKSKGPLGFLAGFSVEEAATKQLDMRLLLFSPGTLGIDLAVEPLKPQAKTTATRINQSDLHHRL